MPDPASSPATAESTAPPETALSAEDIEKSFKSRVDDAKKARRKRSPAWKRNIEIRLGRAPSIDTGSVDGEDEIQSDINPDWSLTKTKTANLYSQVPTVQGTHENTQYAPAVPPFMKQLNYELGDKRMNVGVAMEEVLNDVVNASGIGAVIVGYAARFETVMVPASDPMMPPPEDSLMARTKRLLGLADPDPPPPPMVPVQRVVSDKFFGSRISPTDLLTPDEFVGSNFDDGDWVGRSGRMSWAEAKNELKLTEAEKEKVAAAQQIPTEDDLRSDPDQGGLGAKRVAYDELYYWRYRVDPDEKSFDAIWKLVYVEGLDTPKIHEPWKGQQYDEASRSYIGAVKFPIRVLTLTYVTDNPIPPSDSAAGRPHVTDLRRSRSQMFQNRERSIPLRGFDVNRVDPLIQERLMAGRWQGMIPINGRGADAIWEVARASYPAEDLAFDQATKADLMESWQIGPNQSGSMQPGRKTAAEVEITQGNFSTVVGQERAKCARFFLGICDVLAGLMVLYSDFPVLTDQERQTMQQAWDQKRILHNLVLKIRPDSTIVLDAQARVRQLIQSLNLTAKSGFVNPAPIIAEIWELTGVDPSVVMIQPQGKPPDEPTISLRLSGKEDLINPLVMAMLVKLQRSPTVQEIEQAKQLLAAAAMPPQPAPPLGSSTPAGAGGPGAPGLEPPGPGASGPPEPAALPQGDAYLNWTLGSRIAKRSRDI